MNQQRQLADQALADKLGRMDKLPDAVRDRVKAIYRSFVPRYIEILRVKDNRPRGWLPETLRIDPEIVEDMRHFFSDYQHITNDFIWVNKKIDALRDINREAQPVAYADQVNAILSKGVAGEVMRKIVG